VEGLGYENEPPSPRPLEAIQNSFFTSLVMKNKKGGGEYVPERLRGGADDPGSDSSETPDVVPVEPTPKFKVGDRVIWKRRLQDNHIHGTGTITLVARQPPLIHPLTRVAYNHFCYEIDSAALKEPGIEGQVSDNLIRPLILPAGSWREYVETRDKKMPCKYFHSGNGYCKWGDDCRHSHDGKKGGKRKGANSPSPQGFPLEKRALSPVVPSSSMELSARNDEPPKSKHQKIEKRTDSAN
jgi:hypothetical protein